MNKLQLNYSVSCCNIADRGVGKMRPVRLPLVSLSHIVLCV